MASLIGAFLFAWLFGLTRNVFTPDANGAFLHFGEELLAMSFGTTFATGLFAGWLLAPLVWMMPYAETEKVKVIVFITHLIGLGGFAHCITGSVETMYAVMNSPATWGDYVSLLAPALLGNILGGVTLVAVLNHAQVVAGDHRKQP